MFLLKQLVHERSTFERSRQAVAQGTSTMVGGVDLDEAAPSLHVEISEQEFADRARQVNIGSVRGFLSSELFTAHRFTYDPARKMIIHTI